MADAQISLHMLGSTELRRGDHVLDSFLAGSKRFGVLAYLTLARPRGFHRRDKVLCLFWPERGQKSARNALSNMLYHIRRDLGEGIVVNRGTEEIGLCYDRLSCDVIAFENALDRGDHEQALTLYRGDLLKGFYVPDAAPAFEHWLDRERDRLRHRAAEGAWSLAVAAERSGDRAAARLWGQRAAEFAPFSEDAQQRLIALLHRMGDRAGALQAYEAFAERLQTEWEIEPTGEMRTLVEAVEGAQPSDDPGSSVSSTEGPAARPTLVSDEAPVSEGRPPAPGSKSTPSSTDRGHRSPRMGRSISPRWGAIGTIALVVLAIVGVWAFGQERSLSNWGAPAETGQSVAVLPFTALGAPVDVDYFSLGMTEEILTRLATVGDLSVISRTSVMQYQNTDKPLRQIGAELGVATVVEGSVQREGDRIRITAQLIDAKTDHHLWGASYDRKTENILSVQSEVALRIADALQATLLPQEREQLTARRDVDATAYHLYLRAQHHRDRRDSVGTARAAALFREALRHDSSFAPAHSGLAMTAFWTGLLRWMPRPNAATEALHAAERALALDSTLAEAHLAKALVFELFRRDWRRSEQAFQRTLRLTPSHSEARREYGMYLLRLGRIDSALVQMRRAVTLDPRSWHAHHSLGYALYCARQYEDAVRALDTALDLGSQFGTTRLYRFHALLKEGQHLFQRGKSEEAEAHMGQLRTTMSERGMSPKTQALFAQAVQGHADPVRTYVREAQSLLGKHMVLLLLVGEKDRALDLAEDLMSFDSVVHADPLFDPVRGHPRFEQIVTRQLQYDGAMSIDRTD